MKLRSLVAVSLLVPAVALAAPAGSGSKSRPAPAKPAAVSSSTGSDALQGLQVGGFIGYETDDLSGLSLRLDGEIPFRDLSPQVKLSFVGSLGYSRLSWEPIPGWDFTANVMKIVPAARFTLPLNPQFEVFGDAGLGLAYVSAKVEFSEPGFGTFSASDSSLNIMMRLAAGAFYLVNPQLKLGAMIELDPVFGDYGYAGNGVGASQNTFLFQVGGMFKL
jgi:opacity protein-like surface antigen